MASDPNQVGTATATPSMTGDLLQTPTATNAIVPAPIGSQEIVSLNNQAGRVTRKVPEARARELASKINLRDSQSIITFGVEAHKATTQVSEQMLQGVRTKDMGPAGEELNAMVRGMKGLDFGDLAVGKKPGFIKRLLGGASVLQKFLDRYQTVEAQIIKSTNVLEGHRVQMLKDIVAMDRQYESTMGLLDSLEEQLAALEWLLNDINTNQIPALQAKANETGDMLDSQAVRDMTEARDAVERRHADLLLVRNVTIQALPSIRIVQAGEKGMAEKIQTQILTAVPLWKRTMAVQIAAWRAAEAGKASKAATDFTSQLIVDSAKQINETNRITRTEMERGIFDVNAALQANDLLIATITESIDLAEQGKANRAAAATALQGAEQKLKETLLSAANRQAQLASR